MATNDPTTPAAPAATPVTTPALAATPEPLAGDGTETISLEDARKLRSEAVNLRKRLKAFEDAEEAKRMATLDDVERSKAEVAKAEKRAAEAEQRIQQVQQRVILAEVKMAALAKGIADPDLAALAIKDKLELGDDGMPINLDKAFDALIKAHPIFDPKSAEPSAPEPPATPATAPNGVPAVPATPAMNPGRTNILAPNALTPGTPVRLSDVPWSRQQ